MKEVAEKLMVVMRHMCRMKTMDEFSFWYYGRRIRWTYKMMTGGQHVFWFNPYALEE